MFRQPSKNKRIQTILIVIILATIPCYCLGYAAVKFNPLIGKATSTTVLASDTPLPNPETIQTWTPTSTNTATITQTSLPIHTDTMTPSPTWTNIPSNTQTRTPSKTPTPTETEITPTIEPASLEFDG